jgi:aspartyl-tRNA(Asn)/glutamyl-tRNA(Gln) amidotransferase subunit B
MLSTLGISEAKAEQGQIRCDVNISVWDTTSDRQSTRVEVKNVAGAKNVERAVEFELKRHVNLLETGQPMQVETRRFDAAEFSTVLMRTKTEDPDYRFFQDPDLPAIIIDSGLV